MHLVTFLAPSLLVSPGINEYCVAGVIDFGVWIVVSLDILVVLHCEFK
jgi:hypothetical protein